MKRIWKWLVVLAVLLGLFVGGLMMNVGDVEGVRAKGERLERMARSERFNSKKKRFFNELTRVDGLFSKLSIATFLRVLNIGFLRMQFTQATRRRCGKHHRVPVCG